MPAATENKPNGAARLQNHTQDQGSSLPSASEQAMTSFIHGGVTGRDVVAVESVLTEQMGVLQLPKLLTLKATVDIRRADIRSQLETRLQEGQGLAQAAEAIAAGKLYGKLGAVNNKLRTIYDKAEHNPDGLSNREKRRKQRLEQKAREIKGKIESATKSARFREDEARKSRSKETDSHIELISQTPFGNEINEAVQKFVRVSQADLNVEDFREHVQQLLQNDSASAVLQQYGVTEAQVVNQVVRDAEALRAKAQEIETIQEDNHEAALRHIDEMLSTYQMYLLKPSESDLAVGSFYDQNGNSRRLKALNRIGAALTILRIGGGLSTTAAVITAHIAIGTALGIAAASVASVAVPVVAVGALVYGGYKALESYRAAKERVARADMAIDENNARFATKSLGGAYGRNLLQSVDVIHGSWGQRLMKLPGILTAPITALGGEEMKKVDASRAVATRASAKALLHGAEQAAFHGKHSRDEFGYEWKDGKLVRAKKDKREGYYTIADKLQKIADLPNGERLPALVQAMVLLAELNKRNAHGIELIRGTADDRQALQEAAGGLEKLIQEAANTIGFSDYENLASRIQVAMDTRLNSELSDMQGGLSKRHAIYHSIWDGVLASVGAFTFVKIVPQALDTGFNAISHHASVQDWWSSFTPELESDGNAIQPVQGLHFAAQAVNPLLNNAEHAASSFVNSIIPTAHADAAHPATVGFVQTDAQTLQSTQPLDAQHPGAMAHTTATLHNTVNTSPTMPSNVNTAPAIPSGSHESFHVVAMTNNTAAYDGTELMQHVTRVKFGGHDAIAVSIGQGNATSGNLELNTNTVNGVWLHANGQQLFVKHADWMPHGQTIISNDSSQTVEVVYPDGHTETVAESTLWSQVTNEQRIDNVPLGADVHADALRANISIAYRNDSGTIYEFATTRAAGGGTNFGSVETGGAGGSGPEVSFNGTKVAAPDGYHWEAGTTTINGQKVNIEVLVNNVNGEKTVAIIGDSNIKGQVDLETVTSVTTPGTSSHPGEYVLDSSKPVNLNETVSVSTKDFATHFGIDSNNPGKGIDFHTGVTTGPKVAYTVDGDNGAAEIIPTGNIPQGAVHVGVVDMGNGHQLVVEIPKGGLVLNGHGNITYLDPTTHQLTTMSQAEFLNVAGINKGSTTLTITDGYMQVGQNGHVSVFEYDTKITPQTTVNVSQYANTTKIIPDNQTDITSLKHAVAISQDQVPEYATYGAGTSVQIDGVNVKVFDGYSITKSVDSQGNQIWLVTNNTSHHVDEVITTDTHGHLTLFQAAAGTKPGVYDAGAKIEDLNPDATTVNSADFATHFGIDSNNPGSGVDFHTGLKGPVDASGNPIVYKTDLDNGYAEITPTGTIPHGAMHAGFIDINGRQMVVEIPAKGLVINGHGNITYVDPSTHQLVTMSQEEFLNVVGVNKGSTSLTIHDGYLVTDAHGKVTSLYEYDGNDTKVSVVDPDPKGTLIPQQQSTGLTAPVKTVILTPDGDTDYARYTETAANVSFNGTKITAPDGYHWVTGVTTISGKQVNIEVLVKNTDGSVSMAVVADPTIKGQVDLEQATLTTPASAGHPAEYTLSGTPQVLNEPVLVGKGDFATHFGVDPNNPGHGINFHTSVKGPVDAAGKPVLYTVDTDNGYAQILPSGTIPHGAMHAGFVHFSNGKEYVIEIPKGGLVLDGKGNITYVDPATGRLVTESQEQFLNTAGVNSSAPTLTFTNGYMQVGPDGKLNVYEYDSTSYANQIDLSTYHNITEIPSQQTDITKTDHTVVLRPDQIGASNTSTGGSGGGNQQATATVNVTGNTTSGTGATFTDTQTDSSGVQSQYTDTLSSTSSQIKSITMDSATPDTTDVTITLQNGQTAHAVLAIQDPANPGTMTLKFDDGTTYPLTGSAVTSGGSSATGYNFVITDNDVTQLVKQLGGGQQGTPASFGAVSGNSVTFTDPATVGQASDIAYNGTFTVDANIHVVGLHSGTTNQVDITYNNTNYIVQIKDSNTGQPTFTLLDNAGKPVGTGNGILTMTPTGSPANETFMLSKTDMDKLLPSQATPTTPPSTTPTTGGNPTPTDTPNNSGTPTGTPAHTPTGTVTPGTPGATATPGNNSGLGQFETDPTQTGINYSPTGNTAGEITAGNNGPELFQIVPTSTPNTYEVHDAYTGHNVANITINSQGQASMTTFTGNGFGGSKTIPLTIDPTTKDFQIPVDQLPAQSLADKVALTGGYATYDPTTSMYTIYKSDGSVAANNVQVTNGAITYELPNGQTGSQISVKDSVDVDQFKAQQAVQPTQTATSGSSSGTASNSPSWLEQHGGDIARVGLGVGAVAAVGTGIAVGVKRARSNSVDNDRTNAGGTGGAAGGAI